METVTVSSKYQVVIPHAIRKALGIKPGEKVYVLHYENRIEYIPVKPLKNARVFKRHRYVCTERGIEYYDMIMS